MATYDKLDWHVDAALAAGQPADRAFAHIGLYLAWIVRHDFHEPTMFSASHVEALKRGEISGSEIADDIDMVLSSTALNAEGQAFSDARYDAYVAAFQALFLADPTYGVIDGSATYDQVAPILDRLYAEWVAHGRPQPVPATETNAPSHFSNSELDSIVRGWDPRPTEPPVEVVGPPADVAARVAALIRPSITMSSVRASEWGSSLLNRALKRLEVRPRDAGVLTGFGGSGASTLTIVVYVVPGMTADRLDTEFRSVIFLLPGSKWERREIAGRELNWAVGREFNVAYWAILGQVWHLAGDATVVESAVRALA